MCPRVAKAVLPRVPLTFAETAYRSHLSGYVMNSVTFRGPLRMPPTKHRLLILHLLLHNGFMERWGPAVSQGSASLFTS